MKKNTKEKGSEYIGLKECYNGPLVKTTLEEIIVNTF